MITHQKMPVARVVHEVWVVTQHLLLVGMATVELLRTSLFVSSCYMTLLGIMEPGSAPWHVRLKEVEELLVVGSGTIWTSMGLEFGLRKIVLAEVMFGQSNMKDSQKIQRFHRIGAMANPGPHVMMELC